MVKKKKVKKNVKIAIGIGVVALICIVAIVVMTRPEAEFEVYSLTLPLTAKVGEPATVSAAIRNIGGAKGTHRVALMIDGDEVGTKEVTLSPGETKTITFTVTASVGTYTIRVGESTKSLEVKPAEFEVISTTLSPTKATVGQRVDVSTVVKNIGDLKDTYKAILTINEVGTENKEITIAGGETETVTFTVVKDVEGTYAIGVGGLTKSLQVEGFRTEDLEPKVGDEWQYRFTMENGMIMLMDMEVKGAENVEIGEHFYEAYVMEGSADVEDYGSLFQGGFSVVSCDADVTMYLEKGGLSYEMTIDWTMVLEYLGTTYPYKYKSISTSEVISGRQPDVVKVGDSWNMTIRSIESTTMTFLGETETETTESTSTFNYECIGARYVSVQAGTFYCYEVQGATVGYEGTSLEYYSPKTKQPVKSIEYLDSQMTSLMELVSYDVSQ